MFPSYSFNEKGITKAPVVMVTARALLVCDLLLFRCFTSLKTSEFSDNHAITTYDRDGEDLKSDQV